MQYMDVRNPFVLGEHGAIAPNPNELRSLGYDAIRHIGGGNTGNLPHDVVIALDPSQIYAPYLARAEQTVPSVSPLLAALGASNVGVAPERLGY
jgi:hypothetical protein